MSLNVEDVRTGIFLNTSKNQKKYFMEVTREFEYDMLLLSEFPENIFKLYMEILGDKKMLSKKGIYRFIFHIYNDFEKLTKDQIEILKKVIVENSDFMVEETLKYIILDILYKKMTEKDIYDMQRMVLELHLDDEKNDIAYGVNEMARRYLSNK